MSGVSIAPLPTNDDGLHECCSCNMVSSIDRRRLYFLNFCFQLPRAQPKTYHIHMRSHKLSIFVTVPPSTTIAQMKQDAFSALISPVNEVDSVPKVENENDFELCKETKDKGRPTGEYETLDVSKQLKQCGLASYDTLYLQFRDASGKLLSSVLALSCHSTIITQYNIFFFCFSASAANRRRIPPSRSPNTFNR